MGPRLLALDTSTECLAVGVVLGDRQWLSNESGAALASSRLIAASLALLAKAGLSVQDLDAIAFGAGPGAFTGLRCACAVAQGLAFGAARPVLAIDSLMIVAEDAAAQQVLPPEPIWVAMDARMGEIYAACYRRDEEGWHTVSPPALYALPVLIEQWRRAPPRIVAGSAIEVFGDTLPCTEALRVPQLHDRAHALLALARRHWAAGLTMDPARALPIYLRDKVAFTSAERAAARGLGGAR